MGASGIDTETLARTPGSGSFPLEFLRPAEQRPGAGGQLTLSLPPVPQLPSDATTGGLVDAFYLFFFPAHPFLPPRAHMLGALAAGRWPLLRLAVEYVGCFYVLGAPRDACEAALAAALNAPAALKDAAYVQSTVLYAVGLHMAGREPESAPVMYAAIRAALDLGMNRRAYAAAHGGPGTVMEECLRRTWWEIFVLDGMFSGVNLDYKIQLSDVQTDIPLPIEEPDYVNGVSSSPAEKSIITSPAHGAGAQDAAGLRRLDLPRRGRGGHGLLVVDVPHRRRAHRAQGPGRRALPARRARRHGPRRHAPHKLDPAPAARQEEAARPRRRHRRGHV
jgi:hypothetical protein